MTAIVGIQGKGWAVLAADSMTTYTDKPYVAKGCDKIVKVGEYLVAVAGDATAGDVLYNVWQPPKVIKTQEPDRFMMIRVLPSIRQVICFNGKIYQVSDDYGYMRDDKGLYGIGSGGSIALGALAVMDSETKTHAKASSAAKKAVNVAIQYNIWCGGPVNVKTQFTK